MEQIEIRLLGPLRVRRPAGDLVRPSEWRTAPTRALVAMLALHTGTATPVEQLLEALWPGADAVAARARLRTAASQIRKVMGGQYVERSNDALSLRDAWVDVEAYIRLVAHARHQYASGALAAGLETAGEALTLYAGDLCADLPYADWLAEDRAHLRQAWLDLVAESGEAALALGWWRHATGLAQRIVRTDPGSERACRILLRAHSELGELEPALRAYERCRTALAEELGVDPSPETQTLHRDVLRDTPRSVVPTIIEPAHEHDASPPHSVAERARVVLGEDRIPLLEIASTLAHPFTSEVLAHLEPAADRDEIAATLDVLEDHMVLVRDGCQYRFRPGVREAVYRWLRPSVRRLLHERVAHSDALPRDERLAHWIAAGRPARSTRTAHDAAGQLQRAHAAGSTVTVTAGLGDLPELVGVDRTALLAAIAEAAIRVGDPELARRASDHALGSTHDRSTTARLLRQRAKLGLSGEHALSWAQHAREVTDLDDFEQRCRVELLIGRELRKWSNELATDAFVTAVELADDAGDRRLAVRARSVLITELVAARRFAEAREVGMDAAEIADAAADPAIAAEALLSVRADARFVGDLRTALPSVERAWALVAGCSDRRLETAIALALAATLHAMGRDEARSLWMLAGQGADAVGRRHDWELCGAQIAVDRGQLRAARHHLDRAAAYPHWSALEYQWLRLVGARLDTARGDSARAAQQLREVILVGRGSGATLLIREAEARLVMLEPQQEHPSSRSRFGLANPGLPGTISREGVFSMLAGASQAAAQDQAARALGLATAAAAAADVAGLAYLHAEATAIAAAWSSREAASRATSRPLRAGAR